MQDPLYLFTKLPSEFHLSALLEERWRPLLIYMQEIYGPPLCLNGFYSQSIDGLTPKEYIKHPKKSTWFLSDTRPDDYRTSVVYKNLPQLRERDEIKGFTTQLTIHIPKYRDHSYWEQSSLHEFFNWEAGSGISDSLQFQVERWGISKEASYYHAVQHAQNIIAAIRTALSNQTIPSLEVRPPVILHCPVLNLGQKLNDRWLKSDPKSSSRQSIDDINFLNELIQTKTDSELPVQVHLLLQYYQVYFIKYTSIDARVLFTCK
jgi:hypothetical protein